MKNQYLIVAETVIYKNNKLSCLNIFDQFVAVNLPAEFMFDLAVICGPGWEKGSYELSIKAQAGEEDAVEVGKILVKIPHDNFVYNAIAPNLKIALGQDIKDITFFVVKNEEIIIERKYPVNSLLVVSEKAEATA